jgi:cytochrome c oxidase cbb3-type subunit 3
MKYHRIILISAFVLFIQPVMADGLIPGDVMNYIAYGVVVGMLLLFLIAMLVLVKTFNVLARVMLKQQGLSEAEIAAQMNPVKEKASFAQAAGGRTRTPYPTRLRWHTGA